MTLKIESDSNGKCTTIRLIGRIRSEHLQELQAQIKSSRTKTALDLDEVSIVDLDVIRFLVDCEHGGIEVVSPPPYIREWMQRESQQYSD